MEKTLNCGNCEKKFATEPQLELHVKSCGKVFVCSWCHTPYANLEGIAKHQQNMHTALYKQVRALKKQHSFYSVMDKELAK